MTTRTRRILTAPQRVQRLQHDLIMLGSPARSAVARGIIREMQSLLKHLQTQINAEGAPNAHRPTPTKQP